MLVDLVVVEELPLMGGVIVMDRMETTTEISVVAKLTRRNYVNPRH